MGAFLAIVSAPLLLPTRFPRGGLSGMFVTAVKVFRRDPATPRDDDCDLDRRVQGGIRASDGAESRVLPRGQSCALSRTP
ncbi:MAG: hypothetical protein LC667_20810 [Thioalkalivibrio sp.]|nr:hypothetical protein [Thioalkalivibrio sp.]